MGSIPVRVTNKKREVQSASLFLLHYLYESNPEKFSARKIFSWQFAFTKQSMPNNFGELRVLIPVRFSCCRSFTESNPEKFSARKICSWQFAFTKRRAPKKAWRTAGSDSRTLFCCRNFTESNAVRLRQAKGTSKCLANCGFRFPYVFLLHDPYESNAVRLRQAIGTQKGLANCGFRFPYAFFA